jgi:hypothetical protein
MHLPAGFSRIFSARCRVTSCMAADEPEGPAHGHQQPSESASHCHFTAITRRRSSGTQARHRRRRPRRAACTPSWPAGSPPSAGRRHLISTAQVAHRRQGGPGMATKIAVAPEDDLDGGPAAETVRFAIGGTEYEIDLSTKNAKAFRKRLLHRACPQGRPRAAPPASARVSSSPAQRRHQGMGGRLPGVMRPRRLIRLLRWRRRRPG